MTLLQMQAQRLAETEILVDEKCGETNALKSKERVSYALSLFLYFTVLEQIFSSLKIIRFIVKSNLVKFTIRQECRSKVIQLEMELRQLRNGQSDGCKIKDNLQKRFV